MKRSVDQLHNFKDVHLLLRQYVPPVRSSRGAYTLERMQLLMEFLGNPQESYKVIHVAGTSGKTSTCYYIAGLLKQTGVRTGLTVSPHIDELNERVQIDLQPMAEKKFCHEFETFLSLIAESGIQPTYFEVLTAFAYWEFKRTACEYAVVEVGLGGLLDATNVITNRSKLDVITDIGIDHEEILGKTKPLIAKQKAGIIKPYNKVICYEQEDEVMEVIREVCQQQAAELHEVWPMHYAEMPRSLPLFQRRNWYLALQAYKVIASRDGLPEINEASLAESVQIVVPARMETVNIGNKVVVMDGSHNFQKITALVQSLKNKYPGKKVSVLVSFTTTKQARMKHLIRALLPISEHIIITAFETENHEKTSVDPLKIATICEELNYEKWQIIDDPVTAYKALIKSSGKIKVITGSFYLLNHIRPLVFL